MENYNWNADKYYANASFVPQYGREVLTLLNAKPKESILDLGCGDGVLTKAIQDSGSKVIGIDASDNMIASAKKRHIKAYVMDGENFAFDRKFDAVFSNAALHWMKKPEKVIDGVYQALNHQGRFVGEFGAKNNIKTLREALRSEISDMGKNPDHFDPWYFPTKEAYQLLLESKGFQVKMIKSFNRPTPLKGDITEWLEVFSNSFTEGMSTNDKKSLLERVKKKVKHKLLTPAGWFVDYVRLQFYAIKTTQDEESPDDN